MQSFILAGGLGTRLEGLKLGVPKPMADISNRPFLEHLLLFIKGNGVKSVVICVGHMPEKIMDYFGDGSRLGIDISYSVETNLLGTGGALKLAQGFAEENFLILNGDTLCRLDLNELFSFHLEKKALLTIAAAAKSDAEGAKMEIAKNGAVHSFGGKHGSYVNSGAYAANRILFDHIPANTKISLENEIIPKLPKDSVFAFPHSLDFIDIGTPVRYYKAKRLIK